MIFVWSIGSRQKKSRAATAFSGEGTARIGAEHFGEPFRSKPRQASLLALLKKQPGATLTLNEALTVIKAPSLRDAAGNPKQTMQVLLAPGIYRLSEPIVLDKTSSGSKDHPVIISGPETGEAIISGGREVNDFKPVTDAAPPSPACQRLPARTFTRPTCSLLDGGAKNEFVWCASNAG